MRSKSQKIETIGFLLGISIGLCAIGAISYGIYCAATSPSERTVRRQKMHQKLQESTDEELTIMLYVHNVRKVRIPSSVTISPGTEYHVVLRGPREEIIRIHREAELDEE